MNSTKVLIKNDLMKAINMYEHVNKTKLIAHFMHCKILLNTKQLERFQFTKIQCNISIKSELVFCKDFSYLHTTT